MKTLFKVISQSEPVAIQKQDGSTISKSTIILQEIGGKFENQYVCALLGNQARYFQGDIVYASLRFTAREYQGQHYQDITIQDIISFTQH